MAVTDEAKIVAGLIMKLRNEDPWIIGRNIVDNTPRARRKDKSGMLAFDS
jgi:hypothetical protein